MAPCARTCALPIGPPRNGAGMAGASVFEPELGDLVLNDQRSAGPLFLSRRRGPWRGRVGSPDVATANSARCAPDAASSAARRRAPRCISACSAAAPSGVAVLAEAFALAGALARLPRGRPGAPRTRAEVPPRRTAVRTRARRELGRRRRRDTGTGPRRLRSGSRPLLAGGPRVASAEGLIRLARHPLVILVTREESVRRWEPDRRSITSGGLDRYPESGSGAECTFVGGGKCILPRRQLTRALLRQFTRHPG
jgi:hypothetical protein